MQEGEGEGGAEREEQTDRAGGAHEEFVVW